MKRWLLWTVLACVLGVVVGCSSGENADSSATAAPEDVQTYTVRGMYRERTMDGEAMRVSHEAIPGYMAAMTMDFPVRDTSEVLGFAAGDKIEFTLTLTATDGYAHDIHKLDPETQLVIPEF